MSTLSSEQLEKIRSAAQSTKLFAAVHSPRVIFSGQINQSFSTLDGVLEILYDGEIGNYTDVEEGMTVIFGSEAGLSDLGKARIRKEITEDTIFINETSEIPFADNDYFTVIEEFALWPKHIRINSEDDFFVDGEIEYDDQHGNSDMAPVVLMGSPAVGWLDPTTGECTINFDASESWCLSSGSKTYLWECEVGVIDDNDASSTDITFDTAGNYYVKCSVTVGGVTSVGRRLVFIFGTTDNRPYEVTKLNSLRGSKSEGGWGFSVDVSDGPTPLNELKNISLGSMCVLFAIDYFGREEDVAVSNVENRENIVCVGWISAFGFGASVETIAQAGIEVEGPQSILSDMQSFPVGVEDAIGDATGWTNFGGLNLPKAVFHWIKYRSTISEVVDVFMPTVEKEASELQVGGSSLFEHLSEISEPFFCIPMFNMHGQLKIKEDQQLMLIAERSSDVFFDIEQNDLIGQVEVQEQIPETGYIDLSGISYTSGDSPKTFFSLSPGHVFKRFGDVQIVDRMLISSQAESNERAGLMLNKLNPKYAFKADLAGSNRALDINEEQWLQIHVLSEENPLEVEFEGRVAISSISYSYDDKETLLPSLELVPETFPENAVKGDIKYTDEIEDVDFGLPDFEIPDFGDYEYEFPPDALNPNYPKEVVLTTTTFGVSFTKNFDESDAADVKWQHMNAGLEDEDLSSIRALITVPDGTMYLTIGEFVGDLVRARQKIYMSSGLGEPWVLYYDAAENDDRIVSSIGVNEGKMDEIAFHTSNVFGDPRFDGSYFHIGNKGGYNTTFVPHNIAPEYYFTCREYLGSIVMSNGTWCLLASRAGGVAGIAEPHIMRFSEGGTFIDERDFTSAFGSAGGNRRAICPGGGDRIFVWSLGNGGYTVMEDQGGADAIWEPDMFPLDYMGMAFSPLEQIGLSVGDPYVLPLWGTTDGGASWSAAASAALGIHAIDDCNDDNRFIFGGGTTVRLTLDAGATYVERSGNLSIIAPLGQIMYLRFVK